MRKMLQMTYDTLKIFILFTGCTILFYYGIMWINQEYENYHRYDEPQGTAVKVSTVVEEEYSWFDRLKFFYHYGE
ncbi:YqzK family protein [Litchfieldia alkalitelluris]|uniref:YqzK family protein n=1 Tax=Litchfieldia alkalitelluris TaxID=304268 RepID=UPI000997CE33|nr:YqzK family protein [Litchfieldia alkalitelluris]